MSKKIILLSSLCALLLFIGCSGGSGGQSSAADSTYKIGFSISTLSNPFFVRMKEAAEEYAKKINVSIEILDSHDQAEDQASNIDDFIVQGVDLIIINPVDSNAIGTSVIACNNAGIPVITITRASNLGEVVQHLDIDNKEAGRLNAQQIAKDLNGKGVIAILEGTPGATSATDRQQGFVETLTSVAPDIKVASSLTARYSREEAASVTDDILQANQNLDAIYAHNDEMALGAIRAIESASRDGIKVYGIDATADAVLAVNQGKMMATVQQQADLQIETLQFCLGSKFFN